MIVDNSSQYVMFRIHFYGENPQNFLWKKDRLYNLYKGGTSYTEIIKQFIINHIYNIFDQQKIGEIEYDRISPTEYHCLIEDVPSFVQVFERESQDVAGDVRENHICTSEQDKRK